MKILIITDYSPKQWFLVSLPTQEIIKEVLDLIEKKKHARAILAALSRGSFEKEVESHELGHLKADLILSENSVSWDITK